MNWVDGVLLAVLVQSAVLGLWRGLMFEVLSVAGWVAAFVLAQAFAVDVAQMLPMEGASPALQIAAGFALDWYAFATTAKRPDPAAFLATLTGAIAARIALWPITSSGLVGSSMK